MNISVPGDLKREMDRVKEGINWSAVAAEAFRRKLTDLKAKQRGATMEDVVARMKAQAELDSNESYANGRAAGEGWVKADAKPKQLKRLAAAIEAHGAWGVSGLVEGDPGAFGIGGVLYHAINGNHGGDRREIRHFWTGVLGDEGEALIEDEDFARGFVEGAIELWERIEDQL